MRRFQPRLDHCVPQYRYLQPGHVRRPANTALARFAGTYVIGASLARHQNGSNLPTDKRARFLKGAWTVVQGPVQTKTLTERVITLEFAVMPQLAAVGHLQTWFSDADGYATLNLTGMWGHIVSYTAAVPEPGRTLYQPPDVREVRRGSKRGSSNNDVDAGATVPLSYLDA
jgi:hypothetical protein